MKLLFDANLSWRLNKKMLPDFPESVHVKDIGLGISPTDIQIWNYARINNFTIISLDEDFFKLSMNKGFPPKVIIIRINNMNTNNLSAILQNYTSTIQTFIQNQESGILEIY